MKNIIYFFLCFVLLLFWFNRGEHQEQEPMTEPLPGYLELRERNNKLQEDFHKVKDLLKKNSWTSNDSIISLVAHNVVKYSYLYDVDVMLSYGVLLVENPWLDNTRPSHAGAQGLFQIMPQYWAEAFPECGVHTTVEGNICIGINVLRYYLDSSTDERQALLRYNGCHWDSCVHYATDVYSYMEEAETHTME